MATSITALSVTEAYAALTVLTFNQLHTAFVTSVETYCNTQLRLNLVQLALDVFGNEYSFNDDGIQTLATEFWDTAAQLGYHETVTGSWTFSSATTFNAKITNTSNITSNQQKCKGYINAAAQSVADTTPTALLLDGEAYDVGSMHSVSLNTSRITIPEGGDGTYIFNAQATFAASNVGYRTLSIYKNGSVIAVVKNFAPHATEVTVLNVTVQDVGTATDFYEAYVYQSSGGVLDINAGISVSFFTCIKVC